MMHTKYSVKLIGPQTQTYLPFAFNHTKHAKLHIPDMIILFTLFRTKRKTVAKLTDNVPITK